MPSHPPPPRCHLPQCSQQREVDGLPMAQDAEDPVQVDLVLAETPWKSGRGRGAGARLATTLCPPQCPPSIITRATALAWGDTSAPGLRCGGAMASTTGSHRMSHSRAGEQCWGLGRQLGAARAPVSQPSSLRLFLSLNHCSNLSAALGTLIGFFSPSTASSRGACASRSSQSTVPLRGSPGCPIPPRPARSSWCTGIAWKGPRQTA